MQRGRRQHLLLLGSTIALLAIFGFGCKGGQRVIESLPQIELNYWTAWDEPDTFNDIITAYRQLHPNIRVTVRKLKFEEYERDLLQGWARDAGPDIFSVPNTGVGKYLDFITPMPKTVQLPTLRVSGGCSKDIRIVKENKPTLIPERFDETFLPVVADDVIVDNQIYGLPLATDTLALFYNKDLLTAAKIIAPPKTWQEFVDMVDSSKTNLTKEEGGEIIQSGAALGTAENVNRSVDILSALMMQSGAQMVDASGTAVTFNLASTVNKEFNPGFSALTFYTSFANPVRVTYSWNDKQSVAQEAFAAGKVAFFVGYSYQINLIRLQNPQLNFGVAPLPQIALNGPESNYANYWVETVAKKTQYANEAWDFLLFATEEKQVKGYLEKTHKPTALKSLLATQHGDLDLGVFADQLLAAKSWYHGYDYSTMETAMKEMITSINSGKSVNEALALAAEKIQQTLVKPR